MIPIILRPGWEPDPKKGGAMLKVFLPVFGISAAIAALFGWLLSFTTFPSTAHSVVGICMITAVSAALVSVIPITLALPVWLSGLRGTRLVISVILAVFAFAGLTWGFSFGNKWLFG